MTQPDEGVQRIEGAQVLKDLISGQTPFKVTAGNQTSRSITFETDSIRLAEGATAVFVCG